MHAHVSILRLRRSNPRKLLATPRLPRAESLHHATLVPRAMAREGSVGPCDPPAYKEEFEAIWRQYLSELEVFKLRSAEGEAAPGRLAKDGDEKRLAELATFVSHTCKHYDFAAQRFGPQLCRLLKDRCVGLAPELRLSLVQACVLARSKGLLDPVDCLLYTSPSPRD